MKLCLCDIDNVVANRDARLAIARHVYVEKMQAEEKEPLPLDFHHGFDYETFFTSELVYLDTVMEGVNEALNVLLEEGYHILFLSSRPEHMYAATREWFALHIFVKQACDLSLKDAESRYKKTAAWKAEQVAYWVEVYQAAEVLIVDDQEMNLEAIVERLSVPFRVCTSLAQAIRREKEWVEDSHE